MSSTAHRVVTEPSSGSSADVPPDHAMTMDAPLTWHDRLLGIRDRLLASESFQRFAGTFVLTRPIARRRANDLFDLCAGFVYSQILFASVKLNVFGHVAAKPMSLGELSPRLQLPSESARLLLDAAVSLKLLQKRSGDRYGLGERGAALRGNPGVVAMIEHHTMLYADLADPVALLRSARGGGQLAAYWPYATGDAPAGLTRESVADYTALMAASQPMIAQQVLAAYSFAGHNCLLDVGGGDGSFLATVLKATPSLSGKLFDLPAVAEHARERFARDGLESRAVVTGGSFVDDELPHGADIISLVRVIHDHDDETVMALLRNVHRALPDGGMLLIAEPLADTTGAEPIGDAYFGFYLFAMGSGRPRNFARLSAMLGDAGFLDVALRRTPMPMLANVVTAKRQPKR